MIGPLLRDFRSGIFPVRVSIRMVGLRPASSADRVWAETVDKVGSFTGGNDW
jgi:hypothetical protein